MRLDIPFHANDGDGKQCFQAAMRMVLEFYLGKDHSLRELDKLTRRKQGLWTYTPQAATALHNLGLDVEFRSKEPLEPFLQGEEFIREHAGEDADHILKHTDVPVVVAATREALERGVFRQGATTVEDLERHLDKEEVPVVLVDYNKLMDKDGPYQGHAVVVTGYDEDNIHYHESGPKSPEPHKEATKEGFQAAMDAKGTDNDCIIVRGRSEH